MADFFADYGVIVAFFIGLAGLGTFIWNIIKGYTKRQDEKEQARLRLEEAKAAVLKKDLEERAIAIKCDAEENAEEVKKKVEDRATLIKTEIEMTAKNLREHNVVMNETLKKAISEVDDKVMKMLRDLSERADLTNGNIGTIRNEVQDTKETVQDLKADLIDLWHWKDDLDASLGINEKTKDQTARQKRQLDFDKRKEDFERRKKRLEIKETAMDQGKSNRRYEDEEYDKDKGRRYR